MPLFGVSQKKICEIWKNLKGLKNHENSAQKTVAYVEYPEQKKSRPVRLEDPHLGPAELLT